MIPYLRSLTAFLYFWLMPPVTYLDTPSAEFESEYIRLRQTEGRLLSDAAILSLPEMHTGPLAPEWALRRDTCRRFAQYLLQTQLGGPLLDLGCGNGWFTRWLYAHTHLPVHGVDINQTELETANRLFGNEYVSFFYADIFQHAPAAAYPLVVINAAVQYFPDLSALIVRLRSLMAPGGEIHVLDSPFYSNAEEASAARKRTDAYYRGQNAHALTAYYHHHTFQAVSALGGEVLYHPLRGLRAKLVRRSPFPWIRFRS